MCKDTKTYHIHVHTQKILKQEGNSLMDDLSISTNCEANSLVYNQDLDEAHTWHESTWLEILSIKSASSTINWTHVLATKDNMYTIKQI